MKSLAKSLGRNILRPKLCIPDPVTGGFTLVEMMVTIGIITLLSAALIGVTRTGDQQIILFRESSLLIANLNRVKGNAIQTFLQPGRPCGYGIYIDQVNRSYTLFQDQPSTPNKCATANHVFDAPAETLMIGATPQVFQLPVGVQFGPATNVLNIVYVPPIPDVFINNGGLQTGIITIQGTSGSTVLTIQVNSSGQITTI